MAIYDIELEKVQQGTKPWSKAKAELKVLWRKARKQLAKDYVLFPLLSGPGFLATRRRPTSPPTRSATSGHTR